jgi:hypothetical protein
LETFGLITIGFLVKDAVEVFLGNIFGIGLTAAFGLIIGLILMAVLADGFDSEAFVAAYYSSFAF